MSEVVGAIAAGFASASLLDRINLVLGLVGVWLMIRRSLSAFPVGLVAVAVQGVLFFQSRFYADAALQVFFFVTLAWGWWRWSAEQSVAPETPVQRLSFRGWGYALGAGVLATVVWALALRRWTDAVMPWRDAFIAAFSVVAQVLQARRNLENWPFWIVVNGVAIAAYWRAELAYTAFLYALYLVLGIAGWRAWRCAPQVSTPASPAP
jgi:nicotinamide mononucleotide transporter